MSQETHGHSFCLIQSSVRWRKLAVCGRNDQFYHRVQLNVIATFRWSLIMDRRASIHQAGGCTTAQRLCCSAAHSSHSILAVASRCLSTNIHQCFMLTARETQSRWECMHECARPVYLNSITNESARRWATEEEDEAGWRALAECFTITLTFLLLEQPSEAIKRAKTLRSKSRQHVYDNDNDLRVSGQGNDSL